MIVDDFLEHFVSDTDGESRKEIPLLSATQHSSGTSEYQIQLHCIDEDKFVDLGISDTAEVLISSPGESVRVSHSVRVVNMVNPKTVVVAVNDEATAVAIIAALSTESKKTDETRNTSVDKKHVALRKCPSTVLLAHKPLREVFSRPMSHFTQSNGCLSPKKDTALSLTLLASFLALEEELDSDSDSQQNDANHSKKKKGSRKTKTRAHLDTTLFRTRVLSQLRELGVDSPLKPVKLGGIVGADTVQLVVERFLRSSIGGGVCPATVSVVGSLTAQEAIKSITGVHMPVNQILMFESLDSLLDKDDGDDLTDESSSSEPTLASSSSSSIRASAMAVYGPELAEEISRLRLFIVGAGAIGCELLKTLALMGAGCGPSLSTESGSIEHDEEERVVESPAPSSWKTLCNGGIAVTDMDTIERSNLNRQLLYRERHIGMSKASVAAEMIKTINPNMRIHSLTEKVSPDTESTFNAEFWSQTDVVLPALDNIDARLYVDSLCVRYRKWMVDSGTLGTKGSVQAVIPGLSESYASSADPPEDAIPLCTLKSFPYQPEHCIAWARSVFDRLFGEEVRALRSCLEAASDAGNKKITASTNSNNQESRKLVEVCENLTPEIRASLCNFMSLPQSNPTAALTWARQLFDELFLKDVQALMKEHPVGQLDEDGIPFWSG